MRLLRFLAPLAVGLGLATPASALNLTGGMPVLDQAAPLFENAQFRPGPRVGGRAVVGRPGRVVIGRPVGGPGFVGRPGGVVVGRPVGRPGGPWVGGPGMRPGGPWVGRPIGRPGGPWVGRPIGRPGGPWVGGPVVVGRPWSGRYWRPGVGWAVGSIAAIGVVSAAAAAAWAPPPPDPGYCWYYSDPSMQTGFWAPCQ